jgi:transposase
MYIRKVKKRNGRTKKIYEYLQLVESIRTDNGPRQRLVLNLGNLDLHPSQYSAFAQRVESILTGQINLFEIDKNLEKYAQDTAKKIFKKQAYEISSDDKALFQNIDTNSIDAGDTRCIGPEYICHSIWNELNLYEFFSSRGIPGDTISLIESLVVGRLIEPASERHTKEWSQKRSAIFELTGNPFKKSLSSYYRAGDRLYSQKDELEEHLSSQERDIFSLSEKMFFFDLTNTYFEGDALKNPKAKRGRSKEKRSDCKLVTLGLVIDEIGFSKYSKVFPGNQTEWLTLEGMIEELEKNTPSLEKKRTIVMDAGVAVKKNIELLQEKGYHYIVVNRGDEPFDRDFTDMQVVREDVKNGIKIEVKRFMEGEEAYILCRSEKKQGKETGIRTRAENLFLERLEYYRNGLSLRNRTKNYKKTIENIGRLKGKYPKAAKLYEVDVIPEDDKSADDSTLCAIDITWKKKEDLYEKHIQGEGSYVLRTDRLDLSDIEIWETYIMLTRIEYAFRCMKSTLGLRPNFHQIENRVDAHLFISVLAYHILNIIENRLRSKGDNRTWATIRDIMKTHQRLTISYNVMTEENKIQKQFMRINSILEPEQMEIYRRLELNPVPLPRKKFVRNV